MGVGDNRAIYVVDWKPASILGPPRRIRTPPGDFTHPALSPDGRHIAFWGISEGAAALWLADTKSLRADKIPSGEGASMHPAWSMDSRHIVCSSNREFTGRADGPLYDGRRFQPRDIRVVEFSSSVWRTVVSNGHDNERPAWSPDGEMLAFVSTRRKASDIRLLNLADSGERALTHVGSGIYYRPAWHPDGCSLVFNNKGPGNHYLWRVALDGSYLKRLSPPADARNDLWDHGACWAPDGSGLLFHSNRSGEPALWTMDADGGNARQVIVVGPVRKPAHGTWDARQSLLAFDACAAAGGSEGVSPRILDFKNQEYVD